MIKQWIVHFEWNRKYRWLPAIYITPKIKHGQIGTDGGQVGHFIYCKECSGTGTLFIPDEMPAPVLPSGPHTWQGSCCLECEADISWCPYSPPKPRPMSNHTSPLAMDFNAPDKSINPPETLELNYELGRVDYKSGETVWTRGAEYAVDGIYDKTLRLVRKDLWEARHRH